MPEPLINIGLLRLWWDAEARSAAENLAIDEALLDDVAVPVLRFYQWRGAALTLGYFQRWHEMPFVANLSAAEAFGNRAAVDVARRWTGGGMVDHRGDRPYSLIAPAGHPLAALSATDSYRWIHQALARSLADSAGLEVAATNLAEPESGPALVCFDAAVPWDVVDTSNAQKVAGAAQRRSRGRLLHQGSVILGDSVDGTESQAGKSAVLSDVAVANWRRAFAEAMAPAEVESWSPADTLLEHAADLANTRYGTKAWRERF